MLNTELLIVEYNDNSCILFFSYIWLCLRKQAKSHQMSESCYFISSSVDYSKSLLSLCSHTDLMVLASGHMAESLYLSLLTNPHPLLSPFSLLLCLGYSEACKRPEWRFQGPTQFYLSHYSSWEYIRGRYGAQFHMRKLPPHQAVFKEEQQVAAGRGNLRLSGCQSGIAAESRLFIWPCSHLHSSPLRRKRWEGRWAEGCFVRLFSPS